MTILSTLVVTDVADFTYLRVAACYNFTCSCIRTTSIDPSLRISDLTSLSNKALACATCTSCEKCAISRTKFMLRRDGACMVYAYIQKRKMLASHVRYTSEATSEQNL
jgi:hypothetical protein